MSTPVSKRRRMDVPNQALFKPFRSPFKGTSTSPGDAAIDVDKPFVSPTIDTDVTPLKVKDSNAVVTPQSNLVTELQLSSHRGSRRSSTYTSASQSAFLAAGARNKSPVFTSQLNADSDVLPLLRMQREKERLLKEVRDDMDAAEQAWKIEQTSLKWNKANSRDDDCELDEELVELCEKWKGASRLAAEELFGKVRERVNRMGGPRAWKEAQKAQQEFQSSWQDHSANKVICDDDDDCGDYSSTVQAEARLAHAEYDIDEKAQRVSKGAELDDSRAEEDEFTMATMLRTLNVDLDVIGYDRIHQRWCE